MLVNETKSGLNARDINDLASKLQGVPRFSAELKDRGTAGILAGLSVKDSASVVAVEVHEIFEALSPDHFETFPLLGILLRVQVSSAIQTTRSLFPQWYF